MVTSRKARKLLGLLADHESALTADFRAVYRLRLADSVRDLTIEELWDLVIWLPDGSAFRASMEAGGNEELKHRLHGWTFQSELDLLRLNFVKDQTWILAASNSKQKIPKPEEICGPRGSRKRTRRNDANVIARRLLDEQKG